jgi:hypothetical protein
MKVDKPNVKQDLMIRLNNILKGQARYIMESTHLSSEEKLIQMDIILDLVHFLKDYDTNVKILNKYITEHKHNRADNLR